MAEVRWSLTAAQDLESIEATIARDSAVYAINFVDLLVNSTDVLVGHPTIGRVVPELRRKDVREILVRSYRIVYLVQDDDVVILRVVHGARDLRRLARREEWTFR